MIERLFLYGIKAKPARSSIGCEDDLAALPGAHKTQPALAFVQFAKARTDVALHAAVRQSMPKAGWMARNRLIHAAPDLIFP